MTTKPRILCVDDEPMNLSLLEAILPPGNFEVVTAANGLEALAIIHSNRIDAVLLDVMMPVMDGFEVCRRIKSDDRLRNIPVIMITSYVAKENRIMGIEAGAEDFISKPFDAAEVLARIGMLLRVKTLNDQLNTAYGNITSLIRFGEEIVSNFDPLHFDFMANVRGVVSQIIARSPDMTDNPQIVLVGIREHEGNCAWVRYGYETGGLTETLLSVNLSNDRPPESDAWIAFFNQGEPEGAELRSFIDLLSGLAIIPVNLVCYQSSRISLCALDYGRRVTSFDAEVLNSVVAQSLFLKSLSNQVRETEDAFAYTVQALARAAEVNDEDTGDHILRVGEYCSLLARHIGMPEQFAGLIRYQSSMHDVGKIHISPAILKKPGKLDPEELEMVKLHPIHGAAIIGDHVRLTLARSISLSHHERYDGSGYPFGLSGEQIAIEGRIINLADQYDALRNARCYKPAFDHETTCRIILEGDGRTLPQHFDPRMLAAFREIHERFAAVFAESSHG